MFARILRWWRQQSEADRDSSDARIDAWSAARGFGHFSQSDAGSIPPNYLPTGIDEGRPKK